MRECSIGEARAQVTVDQPWSHICSIIVDAWDDCYIEDDYHDEVSERIVEFVRVEVSGGTETTTWAVDVPSYLLSQFTASLIMFDAGEIYQLLIGSATDDKRDTTVSLVGAVAIFDKLRLQRKEQDETGSGKSNLFGMEPYAQNDTFKKIKAKGLEY